ncbi:hypothetical protein AADZ86_05415 [Colwelliaceae bacterium BS250]
MKIKTKLVKGYGVASGKANDSRFMQGTIAMQKPYFLALGLDLSKYFNGTLNLNIGPCTFDIIKPDHQFNNLLWCANVRPENFSFVECEIIFKGKHYRALIYRPSQETKTQHFQSQSTVEVLSVYIADIKYGDELELIIEDGKVNFGQ